MPIPGEAMFSDEWMHRNAAGKVPAMFMRMCRDICKGYGLGNDRDIEMVWLTIKTEMKKVISYSYKCGVEDFDKDGSEDLDVIEDAADMAAKEFIDPPWHEYGN